MESVSRLQENLTRIGYCLNEPLRASLRSLERGTRSLTTYSCWQRTAYRIKEALSFFFCSALASICVVPAFFSYSLAAIAGRNRFQCISPKSPHPPLNKKSIKVLSLNACCQDPCAPFTGGVVHPAEPVGNSASRVEAIFKKVQQENPSLFLGQEFDSIHAQDEFIRLMKGQGYRYFIRDFGSNDPIRNHSGLLVASKVPLEDVEFIPFRYKAGFAQFANQGALVFTVRLKEGVLRLINTHLNYGEREEDQTARCLQLKHQILPLLRIQDAVLFGDINLDTADPGFKQFKILDGFVNALEGQVTCTDHDKHILRGKSKTPEGKACTNCAERIDALIYNPAKVKMRSALLTQFKENGQLLSDHYATIATLGPNKKDAELVI